MIDPYKAPETEPVGPQKASREGLVFVVSVGCAAVLLTALLQSTSDFWNTVLAVAIVCASAVAAIAVAKMMG